MGTGKGVSFWHVSNYCRPFRKDPKKGFATLPPIYDSLLAVWITEHVRTEVFLVCCWWTIVDKTTFTLLRDSTKQRRGSGKGETIIISRSTWRITPCQRALLMRIMTGWWCPEINPWATIRIEHAIIMQIMVKKDPERTWHYSCALMGFLVKGDALAGGFTHFGNGSANVYLNKLLGTIAVISHEWCVPPRMSTKAGVGRMSRKGINPIFRALWKTIEPWRHNRVREFISSRDYTGAKKVGMALWRGFWRSDQERDK